MRCFVAVVPPAEVLDAVAELPRPAGDGVRWTTRDQWHVTLRFLGDVEDPALVVAALEAAALPGDEARLGPAVAALGRNVVAVPVAGLDRLAAAVAAATAGLGGQPTDDRRFRGHLTLARVRRGRPRGLTGARVEARFEVHEVAVVRSRLDPDRARYETLATIPTGPA